MTRHTLTLVLVALVLPLLAGCVTAKKDTTGFAVTEELVVDKSFEEAWLNVKDILVAQDLTVYTRDKRGYFEAYQGPDTPLPYVRNRRMKYTVNLFPVSRTETRIRVEAMRQVYGTSLRTYPDWHDRQTEDSEMLQSLVSEIRAGAPAAVAPVDAPAAAEEPEAPMDTPEEVVVEEI